MSLVISQGAVRFIVDLTTLGTLQQVEVILQLKDFY